MSDKIKEYSVAELAQVHGREGRVLIAYQGKVFDVSQSKFWRTGTHMHIHPAGQDLTDKISAAPHGPQVLERYPQVGVLKDYEEIAGPQIPPFFSGLLHRFPILRRHPHPMTVHFPIAYLLALVFFQILYFLTGNKSFELTALNCLGAGVLFTPLAIFTGLFTWWLNYDSRLVQPVKIKIILAPLMFILAVAAFVWRLLDPEISQFHGIWNISYFILIFLLAPLLILIGWYGAKLTFPISKD